GDRMREGWLVAVEAPSPDRPVRGRERHDALQYAQRRVVNLASSGELPSLQHRPGNLGVIARVETLPIVANLPKPIGIDSLREPERTLACRDTPAIVIAAGGERHHALHYLGGVEHARASGRT